MPEKLVQRGGDHRFRMLMIGAGYEEGNDADTLRSDPMCKGAARSSALGQRVVLAIDCLAAGNLADLRALLRLGQALVEQCCGSFRAVPKRIVLDIDDTFDL